MFLDQAKIYIRSGKGGDGHVSFRRELYVQNGGPDGGDGGKGGDIIFEVEKGLNTLQDFRHVRKYVARDGEPGGKRRMHGKNAEDLIIKVPEGTILRDEKTGKIVADMSGENLRRIILPGGEGGTGNMHYATSTMQIPRYAKPGKPGRELYLTLELKCIADVGLLGFPSVGKSTLISVLSNAKPEVAAYPFTTLHPILGVVKVPNGGEFIMADIPGIIEGASEGVGLGLSFLRHVERCKLLLHMVDLASLEGRDPLSDFRILSKELEKFSETLSKKPIIVVGNKIDSVKDPENAEKARIFKETLEKEGHKVFFISGVTREGIPELLGYVWERLSELPKDVLTYEADFLYETDTTIDLPYEVVKTDPHTFSLSGPRIEKMLGFTNLDSEKGFRFFQEFIVKTGIQKELENLGIEDGDTVNMYGHSFDYYK